MRVLRLLSSLNFVRVSSPFNLRVSRARPKYNKLLPESGISSIPILMKSTTIYKNRVTAIGSVNLNSVPLKIEMPLRNPMAPMKILEKVIHTGIMYIQKTPGVEYW